MAPKSSYQACQDLLAAWQAVLPKLLLPTGLEHSSPTAKPRTAVPPGPKPSKKQQQQRQQQLQAAESVPVEVQSRGRRRRLRLELGPGTGLGDLRAHVAEVTGIASHNQLLVLTEERRRTGSLGSMARRLQRQWEARPDLRSMLTRSLNLVFLPELFNRELYGRGWIGWAKSSNAWRQLQMAQNRAAAQGAAGSDLAGAAILLQVELLSGQTEVLAARPGDRLCEVQQLVERKLGVLAEQQRFLVVEQPSPGVVGLVTNTVLLHSLSGAKAAVALASWASCSLVSRLRGTLAYPITVRRENGACSRLTVSGDTTVAQIQGMLYAQDLRERGLDPCAACPTLPAGPPPQIDEIAFGPPSEAPESWAQGVLTAVRRHSPRLAHWGLQ